MPVQLAPKATLSDLDDYLSTDLSPNRVRVGQKEALKCEVGTIVSVFQHFNRALIICGRALVQGYSSLKNHRQKSERVALGYAG